MNYYKMILMMVFMLFCLNLVSSRMLMIGYKQYTSSELKYIRDLTNPSDLDISGQHLSPFLIPRVAGSEENKKVRRHIVSTLRNLGWFVEEDVFSHSTPIGSREFGNIIATRRPNSAVKRITFAAHLDSLDLKDKDGNREFIGATDSAASCALLMDMAFAIDKLLRTKADKTLSDPLQQLGIDFQLIFFDGEEAFIKWSKTDSLYGSRHLAKRWLSREYIIQNSMTQSTDRYKVKDTAEVLILLDLLGVPLGKQGSFIQNLESSTSSWFSHLVDVQYRLADAGLLSDPAQALYKEKGTSAVLYFVPNILPNSHIEDDHVPFKKIGVPTVHLIPYPFPEVWHKFEDDRKALSHDTIKDLSTIFKCFIAERLGLLG